MRKFYKMGTALLSVALVCAALAGCSAKEAEKTTESEATVVDDYTVKLGYYNCDHMLASVVARDAGSSTISV